MNRFVASVIAGDGLDRSDWSRLTDSLKGHVDAIALSWNGKRERPPRWMFDSGIPVVHRHLPWDDDFAAQRNESFRIARHFFQADLDKCWILWIDTDDELKFEHGDLHTLVDGLDDATTGVFLRYDYSLEPNTGVVIVEQWRERLLRADVPWKWSHRIHETCMGPAGTQWARREYAWIVHHRPVGQTPDLETRARNRRILTKALEQDPHEPRYVFYLANEVYAEADLETDPVRREQLLKQAVRTFADFVRMEPWSDSGYMANHRMADILRELGQNDESIDTDLQGIKLKPSWPDSYNGIALSCLNIGDWDRVLEWTSLCIKASVKPDTAQVLEPLEMRYTPYLLRGIAKKEKGMLSEAKADFMVASAAWNPPELARRVKELDELIAARSTTEVDKDALKKVRKSLRGARPERSVAFFTRPHFEPWHPAMEDQSGFGGSETAVMRISRQFADAGWRTVVFGTPGEHEGVDEHGVEWWKTEDFVHNEPFRLFISSRVPEVFEGPLKANTRVLWMHDVNVKDPLLDKHIQSNIDIVTAQTPWHMQHIRRLYNIDPAKLVLMPNGIDTSLFAREPEQRSAPRFVYSSSPDRGLDVLLGLWPEIRGKWPEARLDIFYGWESIDKIVAQNPNANMSQRFLYFKRYVIELIEALGGEEGGIHWRGRTPQSKLAEELYDATAWLYPTFFCETFCITALEMQAAGVLPVTSNRAGLQTTVACKEQLVNGWPNNLTYQREWLKKLEQTMGMAETGQARWMQIKGREHALGHDWTDSFEHWKQLVPADAKFSIVINEPVKAVA